MRIEITETPFDPAAELSAFDAANQHCGAVSSFVGRCRCLALDGSRVEALELEHYPGFTEREIETFAAELASRLRLDDFLVLHRVGKIAPGEAIVLVAAASAHRAETLNAAQMLIDFLKTEAPLWKREISASGTVWIEPTARDYRRRTKAGAGS